MSRFCPECGLIAYQNGNNYVCENQHSYPEEETLLANTEPYGWEKYCPTCNKTRKTSCSACGCGRCLSCGYRFVCNVSVLPPLPPITTSIKKYQVDFIYDGSVEISNKDLYCTDEVYANWFKCPSCKDTMILENAKYCQNCGIQLRWKI